MGFRADENSVGDIEAHGPAEMPQEVIAADKICAAGKRTAGKSGRIKAKAFRTQARGKLCLRALAERRSVHGIHIIKKWAEGLKSLIKVLLGAEGRIKTDADIVEEKKIQSKIWISSTANGLQRCRAGRTSNAGDAGRKIKLLRLRNSAHY